MMGSPLRGTTGFYDRGLWARVVLEIRSSGGLGFLGSASSYKTQNHLNPPGLETTPKPKFKASSPEPKPLNQKPKALSLQSLNP